MRVILFFLIMTVIFFIYQKKPKPSLIKEQTKVIHQELPKKQKKAPQAKKDRHTAILEKTIKQPKPATSIKALENEIEQKNILQRINHSSRKESIALLKKWTPKFNQLAILRKKETIKKINKISKKIKFLISKNNIHKRNKNEL